MGALSYCLFNDHWYCECYDCINEQIILFIIISYSIDIECIIEPTSAIDGSTTQMTLKTSNTLQSYTFDNKSISGRIILILLIFFVICFIVITSIYIFEPNDYNIGIKILISWISIMLILTIYLFQSVWIGESYHKVNCKSMCFSYFNTNKSALNLVQNILRDSNNKNQIGNNSHSNEHMIRTFRDDFYIRYELTGSFIIVLIVLLFNLIIITSITSITFGNIKSENSFDFGVFLVITALSYGIFNIYWCCHLYGCTNTEIKLFITMSCTLYIECIMNPTSALSGALAISLGETTQMTLETDYLAGVASINIMQGMPRIREIINVTVNTKIYHNIINRYY